MLRLRAHAACTNNARPVQVRLPNSARTVLRLEAKTVLWLCSYRFECLPLSSLYLHLLFLLQLLGKECFDIDIALDDTLGREFAEHVNKYLESKGETARGVGVIRSNPDQSKHLETATMMVNGQWIDLVNLRAEAYADEGSRIPSQIEFGTAEQDALRRDLTINSLFYNINTKEVEDLTGRGLEDLRNGVIRTPLPPMQTFLDDPLRVLRAVRFAARFGFSVCEDLLSAASTEEVRAALGSKVSRERVGKETELMLKGRDPLGAVELLYTLGLFDTVFTLPRSQPQTLPGPLPSEPMASAKGEGRGGGVPLLVGLPPQHGQQGLVDLASAQRLAPRFMDAAAAGDDVLVATRLAAALLPLRNCTYPDRKKNPVPVTQHIIRESLKLKASLAEMVGTQCCSDIATLIVGTQCHFDVMTL